jgi:hypothetical protein
MKHSSKLSAALLAGVCLAAPLAQAEQFSLIARLKAETAFLSKRVTAGGTFWTATLMHEPREIHFRNVCEGKACLMPGPSTITEADGAIIAAGFLTERACREFISVKQYGEGIDEHIATMERRAIEAHAAQAAYRARLTAFRAKHKCFWLYGDEDPMGNVMTVRVVHDGHAVALDPIRRWNGWGAVCPMPEGGHIVYNAQGMVLAYASPPTFWIYGDAPPPFARTFCTLDSTK